MSFDPTKLLEARAAVEAANAGKITRHELRMPEFEATRSFFRNSSGLIPGIENLKQSSEQPVKIPVFNKIAKGAKTARQLDGAGSGTTAFKSLTYEGITEEFQISELEHAANLVGKDNALAYLIAEKSKNIYQRIEDKITDFLESNKSPVNAGDFFGALSAGDAKQVPLADKDDFFSGIKAEMKANHFFGLTEFVGSYNLAQQLEKIRQQGPGNDTNLAYSVANFIPNYTGVTNGSGVLGTGYFYEPGSVGIFPWTNQLHRKGAENGVYTWTTFTLPTMPNSGLPGLPVELVVKRDGKDNSGSVTGGEADFVESYSMHIDIALLSAYSSNTDTFIYKYEQMNS